MGGERLPHIDKDFMHNVFRLARDTSTIRESRKLRDLISVLQVRYIWDHLVLCNIGEIFLESIVFGLKCSIPLKVYIEFNGRITYTFDSK